MKYFNHTLFCILAVAALVVLPSCYKDEPLNAEADIEQVEITVDNPEQFFFQLTDTRQNVLSTDSVISFTVRSHADLTALAPTFTLTPGATIVPASGSTHDFSAGPVWYTVTSQDGNWTRRYRVQFMPQVVIVNDTIKYDFEHFELEPDKHKYYIWHNVLADGTLGNDFVTGNPGFKLSMGSAPPEDYPTVPYANGYEGYALKVITRDTGVFGRMANMRIAAGNFFLGEFDVQVALLNAMQATRFGKPFMRKPVKLMGVYQYKRGATYQDRAGNPVPGRLDEGQIYAVLYRNHDAQGNELVLHGDDVQTNPNIVALCIVPDVNPTTDWVKFDQPFIYKEELDLELLANRGYSLTVVFTSSIDGATFQGAIGSELIVDQVRLVCEEEQ